MGLIPTSNSTSNADFVALQGGGFLYTPKVVSIISQGRYEYVPCPEGGEPVYCCSDKHEVTGWKSPNGSWIPARRWVAETPVLEIHNG